MGTVYLARTGGIGGFQRLVALKVMHEHLAEHEGYVKMFLDEARLAARIHHPNVVPIVDVGDDGGRLYLVMDYVEGTAASKLVNAANKAGGPMPPAVAIRIVLDTLRGLHSAHQLTGDDGELLGLVHRDVTPHNILVGVDGVARLTDFGVARAEARLYQTQGAELKGKVQYMSPEQLMSGDIDRRADVFAAGVVLWELLAGARLFAEDSPQRVFYNVLYAPIPPVTDFAVNVPSTVARVCAKALERDTRARWATAEELADALEEAATERGLVATHKMVASTLESLLGRELADRRERTRVLARAPIEPDGSTPDLRSDVAMPET
jgi:serine/threonine-protein kinase